jgi:hypothetical protein
MYCNEEAGYPMANVSDRLTQDLDAELATRWRSADDQIPKFLREVGLTGEECSQSLYILPQPTENLERSIEELRFATLDDGIWCFLSGKADAEHRLWAWPVADMPSKDSRKILLALYVEVHSRLVSWWLTNAWRSEQLASATWKLGDNGQILPAAACARSLLETAAAFWVDSRKLSVLWRAIKAETADQGPKLDHWQDLTALIWQMMWGGRFDNKVPELQLNEKLTRTNVLGLIDKLQRATSGTLQHDYQWLCNAVHPSLGSMLSFAAPMMTHSTGMHAFQWIAPFGMYIQRGEKRYAQVIIPQAVARSATLAVNVLLKTLDVTLRIVDDVALTTGAPTRASFRYWRMVSQKSRSAPCPCRSGKKTKYCHHGWADEPPQVVERF